MLSCRIRILGAFDSLRRELECPCNNQCDRKTKRGEKNNKSNHPIRNFQERKNLCRDLNQKPADDGIRDGHLVRVAPLQLRKDIPRIHGCFSSQSFWNAGSPRNGSQCGSSLRSAGVRQRAYGISKRRCSLGIARFLSPTKTSTDAKVSSALGPATASFPLGSNAIARSASFIAASFWPSTARVTESTCAKFGLSGSFWQSVSSEPSIC